MIQARKVGMCHGRAGYCQAYVTVDQGGLSGEDRSGLPNVGFGRACASIRPELDRGFRGFGGRGRVQAG